MPQMGPRREDEQPRKAHLAAMREVLMTVDAKRILEDLGNLPKFSLPAKIVRNGSLAQEGWGVDCSKVYSPARVTRLADDIGLQAGCA